MARAYFFVVDQGSNWTIRYEKQNYGMYASEATAFAQATEWARQAGVVDAHAGLPIGIPRGATFVDNGTLKDPPTSGSANRTSIATTEATQIAANAACTTARARINQGSAGAVDVRAADGRRLSPVARGWRRSRALARQSLPLRDDRIRFSLEIRSGLSGRYLSNWRRARPQQSHHP